MVNVTYHYGAASHDQLLHKILARILEGEPFPAQLVHWLVHFNIEVIEKSYTSGLCFIAKEHFDNHIEACIASLGYFVWRLFDDCWSKMVQKLVIIFNKQTLPNLSLTSLWFGKTIVQIKDDFFHKMLKVVLVFKTVKP